MKDKLKVRAMHPMVAAGLAWASLRSVIYRKVPVGVEPSWALEAKGTPHAVGGSSSPVRARTAA